MSSQNKHRPSIIIDENQWHWGEIGVSSEDGFHHAKLLPSAKQFTLLAEFRQGAGDGRVWKACVLKLLH